jgi:hypothetical protein
MSLPVHSQSCRHQSCNTSHIRYHPPYKCCRRAFLLAHHTSHIRYHPPCKYCRRAFLLAHRTRSLPRWHVHLSLSPRIRDGVWDMAYNAASLTPVHLCTTRDMQAHIGLKLDSLPSYGYARSYPASITPLSDHIYYAIQYLHPLDRYMRDAR